MISSLIIAFVSIILLLILHELGHFVLAKKFGVKVEEFGLFYPPRILGKKIGETLYSLNLIPFGAFVKLYGENNTKDPRAFGAQPVWQRALIILGGIISFWLIAAILFSIVMTFGFTQAVPDTADRDLINPQVLIAKIAPDSPAQKVDLKAGDRISRLQVTGDRLQVTKVGQVSGFIQDHQGQQVSLKIQRGKKSFKVSLVPRVSYPSGQGPMGVVLARVAQKQYSVFKAPLKGIETALKMTLMLVVGWIRALRNVILGRPSGVQLAGPVGAFSLISDAASQTLPYFLQFLGTLSLQVALINALPIPAVDGGRLMFLLIEKIRGKRLSQPVQAKINQVFIWLLIAFMIVITIKDVRGLI